MWITCVRHSRDLVSFITKPTLHILRRFPLGLDNVSPFRYNIHIPTTKEGQFMNLDEFRAHVEATRKQSKNEAMSVLSATITKSTTKEGK